jgi:hypothetical protein
MIRAITTIGSEECKANLGIILNREMKELEELAAALSKNLKQRVNFAQAFSLFNGALEAGELTRGDVWEGAYMDAIEGIRTFIGKVPSEEISSFLAEPAFAKCERDYQQWKSDPKASRDPGAKWLREAMDSPPKPKSDGLNLPDGGAVLYVWPGNVQKWEKLARRLNWRLQRDLTYIQACFAFFSARAYGVTGLDGQGWSGRVYDRETADAVESHLRRMGLSVLDELLVDPGFCQSEQRPLARRRAKNATGHQRIMFSTDLAIRHLNPTEPDRAAYASRTSLKRIRLVTLPDSAKASDVITVRYSKQRDTVELDEKHVPQWRKLAKALTEGLKRELNFAHACSVFGWALGAGDLKHSDGKWRGCVHGSDVVKALLEYLAMSGPLALDRLLASSMHRRLAREYEAKQSGVSSGRTR